MKQIAQGFVEISSYLPAGGITHDNEYELEADDAERIAELVLDTVEEYVYAEKEDGGSVCPREYRKAMEQLAVACPEAFIEQVYTWEDKGWVDTGEIINTLLEDMYDAFDE